MKVITGAYKGTEGRVLEVNRKTNRAIVEGVNVIKKHTKPDNNNPQGGIIEKESTIHISNILPVDPSTGEATRVGRRLNKDNKLVRYSKKSGEEIK